MGHKLNHHLQYANRNYKFCKTVSQLYISIIDLSNLGKHEYQFKYMNEKYAAHATFSKYDSVELE